MSIKSAFIRKRGNNYNVYIEYIDVNGKTRQKSKGSYKTKKDADKHLIEIKSSINNNNNVIISKNITLVDRCYEYMEQNYKDASPLTIVSRENYINKNVKTFFKDTLLEDVNPSMMQSFAYYLFENYSYESFQARYSFVRAVLRESYRLRELKENITDFVKLPSSKEEDSVPQVYNREEVKYLIDKIHDKPFELPILLMLTLGLRVGEATGLRWQDIDFEKNTISINQILIYVSGQGIIFKSPKTKDSKRTLSVPSQIMYLLEVWKEEYKTFEDKLKYPGIVCLNTNYLPYTQRTLYKAFNTFLDKIELRKIRLHDLRHTNATMMILGKTDMKTVSKRLGHTDIKISMNRYSHVLEEMDRSASDNISNIMFD